jgi:hypothetical protein
MQKKEGIVMKMNYLLIGLAVLVAVVPQTGFAQGFCHWSYSSGQSICNTNSGNVGIGTTAPDEKLVIYNSSGGAWLKFHTAFETAGGIIFEDHGEESPWEREVGRLYNDGGTMVAELPHDGALFTREEYPNLRIAALTGDVGIGTAYPDGKLHVEGEDIVLADASYEAQGRLFFQEYYDGTWGMSLVYNGDSTTWHSVPENCFGIVRHQDDATGEAAVVVKRLDGKVGIGVSSPQRTLHVKDVMRLEPQSSAPTGGKGDLYASTGGKLYFHNGSAWKEVSFEP